MDLYVDSSALVKLVLDEPERSGMQALWRDATFAATSAIAYVELHAAIAAAARNRRPDAAASQAGRRLADALWARLVVITPDSRVLEAAAALAWRRALRSADAIHLASALDPRMPRTQFVTFDRRLADAARAEGLGVAPALGGA